MLSPGPLHLPVPIVFTACQGVQQITGGSFNILSIYDRLTIAVLPDGTPPETVRIQVVTVWTGGQGDFEQILRLRTVDGAQASELRTPFHLNGTSARHYVVSLWEIPACAGIYTMTVARPDMELLRQDFTIEIQAAAAGRP